MGNAATARTGRFPGRPPSRDSDDSADNTAGNMRNAGAGWYYDPDDEAIYRYWDGERWTDHRSDTVLSEIPS